MTALPTMIDLFDGVGRPGRPAPQASDVSVPPMLSNEEDRLKTLARYECSGALTGDTLNRVVALAAMLFRVPIALVSLVGKDSQCFVGRIGVELEGTSRSVSFCAHTIAGDGIFTIPDAAADPRFADNPLVRGEPGIRFYAGAPLLSELGHPIGALCIVDRATRPILTFSEKGLLTQLAALATSHLDDRRRDHEAGAQALQSDFDLSGFSAL